MSRSIHKTIRRVFKGKSIPEVIEMCDQKNPDHDVAELRKKVRYKCASGRGKYKTKNSPIEYTKHISVSERDGRSVVTVDDYELFDYLDDFFTEQNIESAFISRDGGNVGGEFHSIHFNSSHSPQAIFQLLCQIPLAEIERIYTLNHPKC